MKTCKDKLKEAKSNRLADIRKLWELYKSDPDAVDPDLGNFNEYGLSFDYVAPNTFNDQRRGYWRYQLSYGGPSEEIRFYGEMTDKYSAVLDRAEFWYLDWFDGAKSRLAGKDHELAQEIFNDFAGCGTLHATHLASLRE